RRAQQTYPQVALADVAQHTWHDLPALEGSTIGAHRLLAARASRHVTVRFWAESLARLLLQLFVAYWGRWALALHASQIDLQLALRAIEPWRGITHDASPPSSGISSISRRVTPRRPSELSALSEPAV